MLNIANTCDDKLARDISSFLISDDKYDYLVSGDKINYSRFDVFIVVDDPCNIKRQELQVRSQTKGSDWMLSKIDEEDLTNMIDSLKKVLKTFKDR